MNINSLSKLIGSVSGATSGISKTPAGQASGAPSSNAGSQGAAVGVDNQLLFSIGSTALTANVNPQTVQVVPNYYGLPMTSFKITLTVADTVGSSSAPTGVNAVETALKNFQVQTNDGRNITLFDGSFLDISATSRYITQGGLYNASPTPADTTTSTTYTSTWNIIVPIHINASFFPLKVYTSFNTIGSRATTLNSMTSTVSLSMYGNYHNVPSPIGNGAQIKIVNRTIPVTGTGTPPLQQYYDQGSVVYLQAYQYGKLSTTDSTQDNAIGSSGTGITFTSDGSLQTSNAPLQSFIDKENIAYANTISAGNGHVYGLINLFTSPFVVTAATNLSINFTSTPSVTGGTDQIRSIWVEGL